MPALQGRSRPVGVDESDIGERQHRHVAQTGASLGADPSAEPRFFQHLIDRHHPGHIAMRLGRRSEQIVRTVAVGVQPHEPGLAADVGGDVQHRDFTMEGPYRLVVDLMGTVHQLPQSQFDVLRGGIRSVRTSQYADDVVRMLDDFEMDLAYPSLPVNIWISAMLAPWAVTS